MSRKSPDPSLHIDVAPGLGGVAPAEWDALLDRGDAPLLSWAYLEGLERAGCVGEGTGWHPVHLLLRRGRALLAAAPAYLKTDSDGEWVYDLDWAAFARTIDVPYYPKLVLGVPFNPVTGRRLLCRPGLPADERRALQEVLLRAAQGLCQGNGLSSAHVHFPREDELPVLRAAGYTVRQQEQYHFLNQGYGGFDDFLKDLRSHRRNSIRREREALRRAGIQVRTRTGCQGAGGGEHGEGFTQAELDQVFDMYVGTSMRYAGGPPYLNRAFFHLCAERLGKRLELVLAHDPSGRLLGGAWNLVSDRRRFGRYWGQSEHVPFLHFEVCFYHSIERTIAGGLEAFEPGHGGEQKLLRGFWPVPTYSGHYLASAALRRPIESYLQLEVPYVLSAMAASRKRCPLRGPKG